MRKHSKMMIWTPVILFGLAIITAIINPMGVWLTDSLSQWIMFYCIGVQGIWAWFGQTRYPKEVASSIGWKDSPFLFEVACANLGMGIAALFAPWANLDYMVAILIIASGFSWGASYGHIKEIILKKNFAPNNAGPILVTDIAVPLILWLLYIINS
jgi:hypothetical protein